MPKSTTARCNLGFIGCGELMQNQHIQNASRSEICRVHTLCDIDVPKMERVARKYRPIKTTQDYRTMLRDPEVQVVVIAMNPEKHPGLAIEALKAGKHVYVEKPMALTIEECRQVAKTASKMNRNLTTGFNRRFAPAYLDVKKYLPKPGGKGDSFTRLHGDPGRVGALKMFYRIADYERWDRAKWDRVVHELVHIFDILCYFAESEPASIYAIRGSHQNDTILSLAFEDKSIASILSTGLTGPIPKEHLEIHWDRSAIEVESFVEGRYYHVAGAPDVNRYCGRISDKSASKAYVKTFGTIKGLDCLRNIGREAAADFDEHLAGKLTREEVVARARGYTEDKGWSQALDEFALAVLEGREPRNVDAQGATRAVVMAEAANEAIRTGKPVKLKRKDWEV